MAWLDGWSKRYKVTIDSDKIDEDLTDFPVLLTLYSGVGLNDFDAIDVFDELSPMNSGTIYSEDFSSANGYGWYTVAGTATYSAQQLQISSLSSVVMTSGTIDFGEYYEILFRVYYTYGSASSAVTVSYFCYEDSSTNYQLAFEYSGYSSNQYFRIYKKNGATATTIFTENIAYNYNTNLNKWFWVKARRSGTRLQFKIWLQTQAEPPGWNYDFNDTFTSSFPTSGRIRFYCNQPSGYYDDITVRTFTPTGEKKIAVTTSDGVTQCPVEIGVWDQYYNSRYYSQSPALAYLWTKIPTVASGEDTVFYLYYDKNQTENINYIGYPDSTPAQNVWDSNYVFVGHMCNHPIYGYLKDSTSYNVDSTAFTVDTNNHYHNWPFPRYVFNNSEIDRIAFSDNNAVTNISGALTVECSIMAYSGHATDGRGIARKGTDYSISKKSWALQILGTGPFSIRGEITNTGSHVASYSCYSPTSYALSTRYQVAMRFTPGVETILKVDDVVAAQNTTSVPSSLYVSGSPGSGDEFNIGNVYRVDVSAHTFDGEISEVRVSKVARSDAWLKATYHSNTDNLLTYETQMAPSYYYQGYVKEKGVAAQRTVRLYLRDTGEMMDETTSASGNGYYYLTTTVSGDHFIVVFDDDAGDTYNALILDRLDPTGIE